MEISFKIFSSIEATSFVGKTCKNKCVERRCCRRMKGEAKWKPLMHSSNLTWSPTTIVSPTTFTNIQTQSINTLKFYKIKVIDDDSKKCFIAGIRSPKWWGQLIFGDMVKIAMPKKFLKVSTFFSLNVVVRALIRFQW